MDAPGSTKPRRRRRPGKTGTAASRDQVRGHKPREPNSPLKTQPKLDSATPLRFARNDGNRAPRGIHPDHPRRIGKGILRQRGSAEGPAQFQPRGKRPWESPSHAEIPSPVWAAHSSPDERERKIGSGALERPFRAGSVGPPRFPGRCPGLPWLAPSGLVHRDRSMKTQPKLDSATPLRFARNDGNRAPRGIHPDRPRHQSKAPASLGNAEKPPIKLHR
jgi:hypothetical protein